MSMRRFIKDESANTIDHYIFLAPAILIGAYIWVYLLDSVLVPYLGLTDSVWGAGVVLVATILGIFGMMMLYYLWHSLNEGTRKAIAFILVIGGLACIAALFYNPCEWTTGPCCFDVGCTNLNESEYSKLVTQWAHNHTGWRWDP